MTKFGVHITPEGASMDELRGLWLEAEMLGFEWISVWDHFLPMLKHDDRGSFEGFACQGALAAVTSTPRIGSLVYSTGYRHPMLLAAGASTIDHISNGRLELGLGAGWCPSEYDAFGIAFESPGTRLRRLRESTEIIRMLWANDTVDYDGEFWQLKGAHVHAPVQRSPRIWLGVQGEQLGLQTAAAVADGWNCPSASPEQFARKRSILLDAAPDPDSIAISVGLNVLFVDDGEDVATVVRRRAGASALRFYKDWSPTSDRAAAGSIAGSVETVIETVGRYVEIGTDWVILRLMAPFHPDELARFANDVVPHFATPLTSSCS